MFRIVVRFGLSLPLVLASASPCFAQALQTSAQFKCLGHPVVECRAALANRYQIVDDDTETVSATLGKVDVSGNVVKRGAAAHIMAKPKTKKANPRKFYYFTFNVKYDGIVSSLRISLDIDPRLANTEEQYDNTEIYELMSNFLPENGCVYSSKIEFYRYFNGTLKPTIIGPTDGSFVSPGSATSSYEYDSKRLPFCGAFIDYQMKDGVSTSFIDSDNYSGKFKDIKLSLWSNAIGA